MSDNGESSREPQVATSVGGEAAAQAPATTTTTRQGTGGKVQRRALPRTTRDTNWASGSGVGPGVDLPPDDPGNVHAAAEQGVATPGGPLPHRGQLEGAFGLDLSTIVAHTGPEAQDTSRAMGANAYATGNHVVLPADAGVGLVAHEVTHVLQQQQGVHQSGGVDGGAGDPLEREADAVGAAVERGESVAGRFASPGASGPGGHVQRDTKGKGKEKEKELTDAEKTDLLNRARVDRATTGITLLSKRWSEKIPALATAPTEPLVLPFGQFKQDVYNLLVVDRIDLSPVLSVLDAPGREPYALAIGDVLTALERDLPHFAPITENINAICDGGPIERVRTVLISHHAQLSPWGKRALAQVGSLGFEKLNTYFTSNAALNHGQMEDERLGLPKSYMVDGAGAREQGRGIMGRSPQVVALVQMIKSGLTPIDEAAETPKTGTETPAAVDEATQAKVTELTKAIETAIATAEKSAADGKTNVLAAPDVAVLSFAIENAGSKARDIVFADAKLMSHLALALDRNQAKAFFEKLDPIERLYKTCDSLRAGDEDPNTELAIQQTAAWEGTQKARERYKLKAGGNVFGEIRRFLLDHAGKQHAALRLRVQDHTKLKDDFIDRLPPDEQRKIYRLIHRGSEDPTAEDRVHEAAAKKQGLALVTALRELAGSDPVRLKDLEKDMVFRTAALSMNEPVQTGEGLYVRPAHLCLQMWGLDPGDVESTDPGTLKLTEVDPTGNNTPLTMDERLTLEETLFGPCIQQLNDELTGKNDRQEYTSRGDQQMRRDVTRHMVVDRKGDPQAVSNILVNFDRTAAQPDMVALLRRSHLVFGREIERRYLERYGVELRQWIYDNSGPVNRSGANRVLGNEQGGAVGMFNGQMMMAGEMDQSGKMSVAQALREHIWPPGQNGRPIYEWASVSSRAIAANLGNKQKLLDEWKEFKAAVDGTAPEMKTATGVNIRAIDLLRNAYMEHTGHFQTNLEAKYASKPDDLTAIKNELGLTADVDTPLDAPPPSVEEQGHKMYKQQAGLLWKALGGIDAKSDRTWYSFAATAMKFRFLPRIPDDPSKPAAARPAEGQEGYTIEEVPPKSFSQYYRVQYGTFPDLHAAAVLRALGEERAVPAEDAARMIGIDPKLVTGEWVAPQERPNIGAHNRHLVRADFDMDKAKTTAAEIWNVLLKESRFDTIQDLLGRFIDEEQRLIRAEFRRLSGGIDLTFYIRQAIDARERERVRRTERQENSRGIDIDLINKNWEYQVKVGTEGTAEGKAALKDPKDTTISTRASDAQLEQMLAISMSGNMDVRTRLRAACKRDAWSEIKQIVDELTIAERKLVLQDGPLMNEMYSHLEQYDDERIYKVLTGQGDLADRLYSRSHGDSWSERHLWGGTDEAGMRKDIRNYLRELRLKYNAEIRALAGKARERNPNSPPIDPGVIDREVNRRVVADGLKLASDSKVRAIFESELTDSEKAEMTAMLMNPTGEARDWAVAGGAGKNDILADIRSLKPDERLRRLNDPNYMQLLGERLKDEKDYRDAVNALKEGTTGGGDGLSKLDEHSRSGAQTEGSKQDKEETLQALTSLSPSEFEALKGNPRLQLQVLSALDAEGQAVARAYLAGPGSMPLAIETAGKVQDEAWGGGEVAKRDAAGPGGPVRTESIIRQMKPGEEIKPDPQAEKVDPAAAQKAAEDKLIAERKEKYVRFMVHQAIHRVMGACRTHAGWMRVLEEAVEVYKLDLPAPGKEDGPEGATSPRRVIWDAVAPSVAAFGVFHDGKPFEMTKQKINGTEMKEVIRLAVLGKKDPSDDLVAESIVTVDEQVAEEEYKKKQNNGVVTGAAAFNIKKDHVAAEDDLKSVVSSASDDHVIKAWSTYLAPPPGGSNANTMKARYDEYRAAFKAAAPALKARYQAPPKPAPKQAAKPAAPTAVPAGGKDMDKAIDGAADKAKEETPTPTTPLGALNGNEKDPLVAQMELARGRFIQFQVGESSDFEKLLRPYMGDGRELTVPGSYNPSANKLSVSKNKRYNNLVEALLSRVTQIGPGAVATALQVDKDDKWLLETGLRDESAHMALSMQKNLRYSGLQRDVGSTALAEKETLDVTTFLLNRTFADASADYQIDGQEKDTLAFRRSENDRARDSYKAALETAAMWASLITSVLLTVAATILTGGLALGPIGAMAIGGVTMLLSAHAQAAVNKDILKDEFDTKDKADLVAREVMTGLVTMGTTFFAQGILSVAGKGMRLAQQAAGIKAVLGKPPSIWAMFLREASEEVTSELADNYVQAHLEAADPEHWVHGYKIGAKRSAAAADAIRKSAPDNAFTGAVTALVTAGVGRLKGRGGTGKIPEFEAPSAGRKRQVSLRKNLKQAFGDPEEKFTAAGLEWLMSQAQNGSIDWENAPASLLQGLLQEYKEVGHEAHIASANQGMKARKVDRHLARHGHLLQSEAEVTEYKKLTEGADDASPFVTVRDYARIRTEVAVAGLQAYEAQHGPLTTLQRDEFVKWVREAKDNDELQQRARRDPMSEDRIKFADAKAGANTAVGKPMASAETAARVMRDLADGNTGSLHELGIQVPPGFDPTKNEWGLGRRVEPNGKTSYILIRGEGSAVDWEGFPGVEPIGHSHPDKGPDGRQSNHLTNVDASGGVSVVSLVTTDGPNRIHFLPSGADVVFCLRQGIQEHTVFTPFQHLGNGMVGNPKPGANNAGINIVIKSPTLYGFMMGNRESPVAQVQIEIWAAGADRPIHTMTLWGSDHIGGSWLYHQAPGQREGVELVTAGAAPGAGPAVTPTGRNDGGPVPSDIHDRGDGDPSARPTQVVPAQTDPRTRPTQIIDTQPGPHTSDVDSGDRPTGQYPVVDPSQTQGPPAMPDVAQPTPTGNRPARPDPHQRVINRTALTVFDDMPQLSEIESVQGEAMVSGGHVLRRAQHALQALSQQDYEGFKALVQSHSDPVARAFLFKALAAGNTMDDVYWLSDEISGHDSQWLIDNLTLGDPRAVGGGIQQQWSTSCNAATTLMVRGNYDPVFALKFRQTNAADPMGTNAHQAQLEQQMLESQYGGNWQNVPPQGHAVAYGMPGGIGRAADDLLNQQSAQTGLDFTPHVPASQGDAASVLDSKLREGMQVPIIVGGDGKTFAHYILAMQRRETAGNVEFLIHDPGGQTRWISAADIAAGRADFFGYSRIDGLDVPSDINSPADAAQLEGGGGPGTDRRDDQNNQNQNDQQNQQNQNDQQNQQNQQPDQQGQQPDRKGSGNPVWAVRLSDVVRDMMIDDDPKASGNFDMHLPFTLPNGRQVLIATGGCKVDQQTGQPTSNPSFYFESAFEFDQKKYSAKLFDDVVAGEGGVPVGSGESTPLTRFALSLYIDRYQAQFGKKPDAIEGGLAFDNKKYFQQEFFKNKEKGMSTDDAAVAAVAAISYGTHRQDLGYGDFEVQLGDFEMVDLGTDRKGRKLGTQKVPVKIDVVARKSAAPAADQGGGGQGPAQGPAQAPTHQGPGGPIDWMRRVFQGDADASRDQGNAQQNTDVVGPEPTAPVQGAAGPTRMQNLANDLGQLLQRDPGEFVKRYRSEMAELEDHELVELNRLLRTTRVKQGDESRLNPNQRIELHRKRLSALREIGAFEQMSFHGSRSEMVEGLATTGGEILPAAELQNRGLAVQTGEGNKFTPNAQPKDFISIGQGESGFGTSLAYADASSQVAHYNVKLIPYDEIQPHIERLDFIIANYDSIDVQVQGPMRQMVVREKAHFLEERDKLQRELTRRDGLPAGHPSRAGGVQGLDNYPVLFEFDLGGSTLRTEQRAGTKPGQQLGGEASVYGPIDLKTRLVRAYAPAAKLDEVRDKLRRILGHDDFEVIALEATDALAASAHIAGSRDSTLKMLADMEKEFEYIERTYSTAARERRTLDMMLYFQERAPR